MDIKGSSKTDSPTRTSPPLNYEVSSLIKDPSLLEVLHNAKITKFTPIQAQSIQNGLFYHRNLLVISPSGSGKTLIALLAIAKKLIEQQGRILYLVPYKALAQEKQIKFTQFLAPLKTKVRAITSDTTESVDILTDIDVVVTTYEKCDALFRMENPFLKQTVLLIIDEIHEIGNQHRGGRLEFLLIRLFKKFPLYQSIALSATIANYREFKGWLSTLGRPFRLVFSNKRPVPLKIELRGYSNKLSIIRQICKKHLQEKGQVILFVNRRSACIQWCRKLHKFVHRFLNQKELQVCSQAKKKLQSQHSLSPFLTEAVESGMGYHNAALSFSDRAIVEENFSSGVIKVLVATTTLAAGINLPARAVIVENVFQFQKYWDISDSDYQKPNAEASPSGTGVVFPLDANLLFQMLGRAGRMGLDQIGYGYILLANGDQAEFVRDRYFFPCETSKLPLIPKYASLNSKISNPDLLQELILLLIAEYPGVNLFQIEQFLQSSFFVFQLNNQEKLLPFSNLMKNLFISDLSLKEMIYLYSEGSILSEKNVVAQNYKLQIHNFEHNRITATVRFQHTRYHINLSQKGGISCTCRPSYTIKAELKNKIKPSPNLMICKHVQILLTHIAQSNNKSVRLMTEQLLQLIFSHEYILPFLMDHRFISTALHQQGYFVSDFGKLTLNLFIPPKKMLQARNRLEQKDLHDIDDFIHELHSFAKLLNHRISPETKSILLAWIEEHTVDDILIHHPKLGVGDLFHLKNEIERISGIFEHVSHWLSLQYKQLSRKYLQYSEMFHFLKLRIRHGVKEDLLSMMEVFPKLSRNRARILANSGYISVQRILTTSPRKISHETKIPLQKLQEIVNDIVSDDDSPISIQRTLESYS